MANIIAPNTDSTTPQQAFPCEKEIILWDFEKAVSEIRPKLESFKKKAVELAKDLYIAHEALVRIGGDRKSESAQNYNWGDFCDLIGISRKTAWLYTKLYDPIADRVRDPEELSPKKKALQITSENEKRIQHALETGVRLAGWTNDDEKEFKKRASNARLSELASRWGHNKIKMTRKNDRDYFAEAMQNAKKYTRISLISKEQTLAQYEIFDNVGEYLKTFSEPDVRLSAAFNLGLRIRDIINELADREAAVGEFIDQEVRDE